MWTVGYRGDFERVKEIYLRDKIDEPMDFGLLLGLAGVGAIFIFLCYFFGVSLAFPISVISLILIHIPLQSLLVRLANTNYSWYSFFSNRIIASLFWPLRSAEGVVLSVGGEYRCFSLGFIILYSPILIAMWYFMFKKK